MTSLAESAKFAYFILSESFKQCSLSQLYKVDLSITKDSSSMNESIAKRIMRNEESAIKSMVEFIDFLNKQFKKKRSALPAVL